MIAMKRSRPAEGASNAPQAKRPKVDAGLVKIWDALADENEDVRVNAALDLLQNHCRSDKSENAKTIATRLFRGLCSSRKNARLGFYVALVGALSKTDDPFASKELSLPAIVSILETQTTPEPESSGQDARDHHFGRLLACKAVIESGVLLRANSKLDREYDRILTLICQLMLHKPWLRNEGCLILCSVVSLLATSSDVNSMQVEAALSQLFQQLKTHKLLKTSDGISVWLHVQETLPDAKLPRDVWTSENPLHSKELPVLKKALLDSKSSSDDDEDKVLGTAGWSPRLHNVWSKLLMKFNRPASKGSVLLEQFWQEVVDDGLFSPSATPERKSTGFLVLGSALRQFDSPQIQTCFSKNLMASLLQALKSSDDAYLGQIAQRILSDFGAECRADDQSKIDTVITGLVAGSGFADFDTVTKTKIVASLLERTNVKAGEGVGMTFMSWLRGVGKSGSVLNNAAKKNLLNILQREVYHSIKSIRVSNLAADDQAGVVINDSREFLESLIKLQRDDGNKLQEEIAGVFKEKTLQIMEALLAAGPVGQSAVLEVLVSTIPQAPEAEADIQAMITSSRTQVENLLTLVRGNKESAMLESSKGSRTLTPQFGLAIMLAQLLHEVCDGDTASAEMLEDAHDMADDFLASQDVNNVADHVVDLVMGFMSKPSKFYRRLAELVFECFASSISIEGLRSLCDILTSSENKEGQLQLFENGDIDAEEGIEGDTGSESGSLDSDVEVMDADDYQSMSGLREDGPESSDEEDSSEDSVSDDADQDDELANFESALAAALGTRKISQEDLANGNLDDTSDDSDSDMSDSQMLGLDEKLAEVFRNQQTQASAQKQRKEEMRIAKENVVNLKNRALDLAELFLRSQQRRGPECVQLLITTLEMARATGTPQLTQRAIDAVKSYAQKSKGAKFPRADVTIETKEVLRSQMEMIHAMLAQKEVSNAVIEVAGQLNVMGCKLLLLAGEKDIKSIVEVVAAEQGSKKDLKRKAIEQFWLRYEAWLSSVYAKGNQEAVSGTANGTKDSEKAQSASNSGQKKKRKEKK